MLQAIPDPMFRLNRQGIILDFKAEEKDLYAASATPILGKRIQEILPPPFADLLMREMAATLETGSLRTFEYQLAMPGVGQKDYEARMVPSAPNEVTAIVRDVTDIKRAEAEKSEFEQRIQQSQKLESLGMLAGGIAHDFNNLLAAIMGNASFALDALPHDSPARRDIEAVEEASRRAAELVRQILTYAGKNRLNADRVDLSALVQDMAEILKTVVSKKATVTLRLDQGLPHFEGDPGQVRQVVMNLIINGSEALGQAEGELAIETGLMDCDAAYLRTGVIDDQLSPGPYAYVDVADTGCGMDATTASRIFEPFFTTKFLGRGLGMSAVLGIMRAHRGTVIVRSTLGHGSTFRVLFPVAPLRKTKTPPGLRAVPRPPWRATGTILFVDDEAIIRNMGERMLRRMGFSVITASDGRQAVEIYRERPAEIALVLCDVAMPQMDGVETLRELRNLNSSVKVVLASGHAEQSVVSQVGASELAGFVQKPFTMAGLRDALRNALGE